MAAYFISFAPGLEAVFVPAIVRLRPAHETEGFNRWPEATLTRGVEGRAG